MKKHKLIIISVVGVIIFLALMQAKDSSSDKHSNEEQSKSQFIDSKTAPVNHEFSGKINLTKYTKDASYATVSISALPENFDEFIALQNKIATTPQGAAVMMLVAFKIYQQDVMVGKKCLTAASTFPLIVPAKGDKAAVNDYVIGNTSELTRKLKSFPYLPDAYFTGATPENAYTPNTPPYTLACSVNPHSYLKAYDGLRIKIFINAEVADSPRPVTTKKVDSIFKVTEYSSLYLAPKPLKQ